MGKQVHRDASLIENIPAREFQSLDGLTSGAAARFQPEGGKIAMCRANKTIRHVKGICLHRKQFQI